MLKKAILFLIATTILLLTIVQFPSIFISKNFEYNSFSIYSNDEIELNESVRNVLDSVQSNLVQSKFHSDDLELKLYFVQGTLYENLIRIFGMKNMASAKFKKHIYIARPSFEDNILRKSDRNEEWLNLIQIISHEGVHSQMYEDYSSLGFMKTPSWINEGYAEYISYKPIRDSENYNLSELYKKHVNTNDYWVKTEYGSMTPRVYLRDRIVMEFLIDVLKMDILSIIGNQTLHPETVLEEMKEYFEKQSEEKIN